MNHGDLIGGRRNESNKKRHHKRYGAKGFADQQAQKFVNKFRKEQSKERRRHNFMNKQGNGKDALGNNSAYGSTGQRYKMTDKKQKTSIFQKDRQEFLAKQSQKQAKDAEILNRKAQQEESMQKFKEKKAKRNRVLMWRTKRGQPNLNAQVGLLLDKIGKLSKKT